MRRPPNARLSNRRRPWGPAVIAGVTLCYLAAFAANLSPILRGPEEWRWAYAIPGFPLRHLLPALVILAYVTMAVFCLGRLFRLSARVSADLPKPRRDLPFLVALAVAVPLIQVALLFPESPDVMRPLFYRTVSPGASGVFTVGSMIDDPAVYLRQYPELMPTFPVHPQRYPPGLPYLFFVARRAFDLFPSLCDGVAFGLRQYQCHNPALMRLPNAVIATAVVQMALPLLSGLTIFPLYGLARRTVGHRAALWAVAFYPLVPSFALWSARWDQFYPLLACTTWYCFHRGLTESRRGWLFLAGFTLSIATFGSFGPVVLLMFMGLTALVWLSVRSERWQLGGRLLDATIFLLGLLLPWALYRLLFGVGFLDIWRVSMSFHLGLSRAYWTWLVYHLYDFFAFLGLPLALGVVVGVGYALRAALARQTARDRATAAALPLGFVLGLVLLDISGTARGEVARVWLFLTPFAVISAVYGLLRLTDGVSGAAPRRTMILVLVLLAAQVLVFNAFLRVVTTGLEDPPTRVHDFAPPSPAYPMEATLGERVRLLGYDLEPEEPRSGETLHLTLYWQPMTSMRRMFNVFTHLVGPGGDLVAQQDGVPQQGQAPTTCWLPGEIIVDRYQLTLPPGAAPGAYQLFTGLYVWNTGERLPTQGAGATPDRNIALTTILVKK